LNAKTTLEARIWGGSVRFEKGKGVSVDGVRVGGVGPGVVVDAF